MSGKQTGLGMACYVDGYNLSGDIGQISTISSPMKPIDVTGIDKSANERIGGQRDGAIDFESFFNVDTGREHPVLSVLPYSDGSEMVVTATAIGAPAACMIGKQLNYDPTRSTAGDLTFKVNSQANAFGLEWANMLTPGIRTDTAATNGTAWDTGNGLTAPAVPASGTPVTNPASLPAQVVISGGTLSNVSVNGATVGTGDGTYTVPPGAAITLTYSVAPTWTWTVQSACGAQAYLQVFGFTGTDATVKLQDSADGTTFTDITGAAFAQITAGNQGQRLQLANTATVRRYIRASTVTTGGFTSLSLAVAVAVNTVAGVVF